MYFGKIDFEQDSLKTKIPTKMEFVGWVCRINMIMMVVVGKVTLKTSCFFFHFFFIMHSFTSQMISLFQVTPPQAASHILPLLPTLCLYEGAPLPTHSLLLHPSNIPLHWGINPPHD